jgi:hypothetical protein
MAVKIMHLIYTTAIKHKAKIHLNTVDTPDLIKISIKIPVMQL